jgi:N-acetylglucosamine-6-phosphate deacetylase
MTQKKYLILAGGSIYTETEVLTDSAIVIKDKHIEAIVPKAAIQQYTSATVLEFHDDVKMIPGFIDMHIHGTNGKDVMDASFDALATISKSLAEQGTTSYLATTMTASVNEIENTLCHVREYLKVQHEVNGAKIVGVHLEGPFLSPDKVGAQRSDLILNPDIHLVEHWQKISGNLIKLITLAPELPGSLDFIRYLVSNNIIPSMGHTNANYSEAVAAIEAGSCHATHLFNAVRGIHQREPGAVTAVLLSDKVMAELIVDGVHLHPAIVQMALKLKGIDKLVLVTDAMRATCLCDGEYDLGGQVVDVKNGVASLKDGTLAGSTLTMSAAIKNMLHFTDCDLSDVVKLTSENPAKSLGLFDKIGSIAPNKMADLVVLDKQLSIKMTICEGKIH